MAMDDIRKSLKSVAEKLIRSKLKRSKLGNNIVAASEEPCFPVFVGESNDFLKKKRYEIPVRFASSEIFGGLLVEYQDFIDDGPISLPCSTQRFDRLLPLMNRVTFDQL